MAANYAAIAMIFTWSSRAWAHPSSNAYLYHILICLPHITHAKLSCIQFRKCDFPLYLFPKHFSRLSSWSNPPLSPICIYTLSSSDIPTLVDPNYHGTAYMMTPGMASIGEQEISVISQPASSAFLTASLAAGATLSQGEQQFFENADATGLWCVICVFLLRTRTYTCYSYSLAYIHVVELRAHTIYTHKTHHS